MKILWVKAGKLLPLDTGGKIRSYNILLHLSKQHEVTLLSYYGGLRDAQYERVLSEHLPSSTPVYCPIMAVRPLARSVDYLRHWWDPAPFVVSNYRSAEVTQLLNAWLGERRFDVAVCDFLAASLNFPAQPAIPCVLFQHNVESVLWERKAQYETNLFRRAIWKREARKMRLYETLTVNRFHRLIAVSEQDRQSLCAMTDPKRIEVVPTGVDLKQFRRTRRDEESPSLVLFVGSMDWRPNIDAVEYFCRAVWPHILSAVPNARFRIVGRTPPKEVQQLASGSVEVTGTVPSIVEHLEQAAVVVVPLRIGGGTRLKIYEAMAAGKAVVSTTIGAEGLDVVDGDDIVLADTATDMSQAAIRLLSNSQSRRAIGNRAARKASLYDWSVIAQRFAEILHKAADRSRESIPEVTLHA